MSLLENFIGGESVAPGGPELAPVVNPADGRTVATVRASNGADVLASVAAARRALAGWRATPVVRRCRILMRYKELLEQRLDELAPLVVRENGKTLAEAQASLRRGLEVVEFAAGAPNLGKGDYIEDIASRIDGYIYREPVGVVTGACPYNFPGMIPLWMFPIAIACGNTFVLKPSEKCPVTATRLGALFAEAGLPPGVLNVVQGGRETFEALVKDPGVDAVSFVGSTVAARHVWELGTQGGKRVQALGGAKNYVVVMPDADRGAAVKGVIEAAFGCAGQRCMAASVLVVVAEAAELLPSLVENARKLRLGDGLDPRTELGPLISLEHKQRVENWVEIALAEGATLLLDGRGARVPALPGGHFMGPTILDRVTPDMRVAREEVFGPVLSVVRARDLDEALAHVNGSAYGNGASIFTRSGGAAREFRTRADCGMIGVNVGVPAPMAFFSFGGRKASLFGDLRAHGPDAIEFYTRKKSVIERWDDAKPTGSVWAP